MATTPNPLVIPFRAQLLDPMGSEFDNLTGLINQNFASPTSPTSISLLYSEFTPEPLRTELQKLVPQINAGFTAVAASTVAMPVAIQDPEQIPEPYLYELLYLVGGVNQGLAAMYP